MTSDGSILTVTLLAFQAKHLGRFLLVEKQNVSSVMRGKAFIDKKKKKKKAGGGGGDGFVGGKITTRETPKEAKEELRSEFMGKMGGDAGLCV